MAMQLEQQVAAKQTQAMHLSARMLESLEILSLPILDLQQRISEELESNPALERVQDSDAISLEETFEEFDNIEYDRAESEWADSTVTTAKKELGAIVEHTASSEQQNLHESLIEQLRLQQLSEREYKCGATIINNLDDNGFHTIDPDRHPALANFDHTSEMIALIQKFEPWGICVADVRQSLVLQAKLYGNAPQHTDTVLNKHLVQLEKRKFAEIARSLRTSEQEIKRIYDYVRTLTPYPGKTVTAQRVQYIMPDLEILFSNSSYHIAINQRAYPRLNINKLFLTIDTNGNSNDKQFIKSYRQQAKWFISALKRRNHTLLRTAYALLHRQHRFFRLGPQHLQPLRLQDIADMLKLHETTVSRLASQKYMQTNWGIYPLSYLFSGKVHSNNERREHSKESVKAIIANIIARHSDDHPLSDQRIAEKLDQKGIRIARRTVAKYRHELGIPNAAYRTYQKKDR